MMRQAGLCLLFISLTYGVRSHHYPEVKRDESVVDEYYGMKVRDPYRFLEDPDSEEVKDFVEAQNKVTEDFLSSKPKVRDEILARLTEVNSYPRYSIPEKEGSRYFFYMNTGLQNQSVLYVQDNLESEARVFLDPNKLSNDGTVALSIKSFSRDGELFAYGLSSKGSDWVTIQVRNVSTGIDFPETLKEIKFSNVEFTSDNVGFFYARYPQSRGRSVGTETDKVSSQKIYYHRVGTKQEDDILVVEFPEHPDLIIGGFTVTRDGKYFIVYPTRGASSRNNIYYANLVEPTRSGIKGKLTLVPVTESFEAEFTYVANDDSIVYFGTNHHAPNYKIVGIDLNRPEPMYWSTIVPEDPNLILDFAYAVNKDKLVLNYLKDVKSQLQLRFLGNGSFIQDIPLEIGTVNNFSGEREDDEFFFNFVSFLTPGTAYRVDFTKQPVEVKVYRETKAPGIDSSNLATKQVFYHSKDGTKVPMFIIHKKDYVPQSNSPTFVYGYGGFNINLLPSFSPDRIVFVQNFDGIYAIPNIRGGGEYGQKWHEGGMLLNKQNVFDDFQAAAEYLIAENYTVSSKLVINGGSNGGLLVGACINQHPELYGAGIAEVGVLDLLRFQKFTIGQAWCSEYGCSDDGNQTNFENLYKLSPYHNVRLPKDPKVQYPAVLVMTGDHDDRVVPLHSYKFIAELQNTIGHSERQTNPLLIRIQTKAGHGAGKPTKVKIAEYADKLTFLVHTLGLTFKQ